jgi:hypothetical protein
MAREGAPAIQVMYSEHLPDTVEAVFLHRLGRVLINGRLWRQASPAERRGIVRRLGGMDDEGYVWAWRPHSDVRELQRPLREISPAAWEQLLPVD